MTLIQILLISFTLLFPAYFLFRRNGLVLNVFEKIVILAGPILLTALFSIVPVIKYGGTIRYASHGWPHFFYMHQLEDVIDKILIDSWHFVPGSLFSYPISNYLFFLSWLFLSVVLVKILRRRN